MKTKIIISVIGVGVTLIGNAYATPAVTCVECREVSYPTIGNPVYGECQRYSATCCEPCNVGVVDPIDPIVCDPTTCNSKTVTDMGGGCDRVASKGCVNNVCTFDITARCQKGYYGTAKLNNLQTSCSGCTACPSSGGVAGTTSGPGATAITECYIPAGTKSSDSTGSFEYTGNCYYKN